MKFLTCVTLSEAKGLGYDMEDFDKFLIGINDIGALDDLPRNRQGRALVGDPTSYRNVETAWMPVLPDARRGGEGGKKDFKMANLLNFAGVV